MKQKQPQPRRRQKRRWRFSPYARHTRVALDEDDRWADLAQYVWRIRIALNASQDDLATALGVHVRTVRRWEAGISEPTASQLRAILQLVEHARKRLRRAGEKRKDLWVSNDSILTTENGLPTDKPLSGLSKS